MTNYYYDLPDDIHDNINKFLDLKQKTRLFGKIGIYLLEDWQKHEIDTIEDLVYIESLFTNKKLDLEFN